MNTPLRTASLLAFTIGCLALALPAARAAESAATDSALRARAAKLHREAIVIDAHNDIPSVILDFGFDLGMDGSHADGVEFDYSGKQVRPADGHYKTHTDLRRLKTGGVDAQFFAVYVSKKFVGLSPALGGGAARRAMDLIETVRSQAAKHSDSLELATSADDIRRISRKGKIAALMGIEGGHAIEDSLATLGAFHRLGVRYMTLTHVNTHDWADSSGDEDDARVKRHGGLTDFGRDVVREMNRLGMMVDISHVADSTFRDALAVTRAPVIASHSSCRALAPHSRNLTDDMLRAMAKNGGVVMLNFADTFLDPRITAFRFKAAAAEGDLRRQFPADAARARDEMKKFWESNHPGPAPLARFIDHIEHVAKIAGVDHVGLGSDYDGMIHPPEGLEDVSKYPNITLELLRRGWKDADVKKVLGENLLRVMEAVEREAKRTPPR